MPLSRADFASCQALSFLEKRGGLIKVLSCAYPTHQWCKAKFSSRQKKSSQWYLYKVVQQVLPSQVDLIEEFVHPLMIRKSGIAMTFDIYVPTYSLVFEYNGVHHYANHYIFGDSTEYKERDDEKLFQCQSLGLTLVQVPYWWRRDTESIIALIYNNRPDIIAHPIKDVPFSYAAK